MVEELGKSHELVLLDQRESAEPAPKHPFIQGDLVDLEVCKRAVDGVEAIVHLGAIAHASIAHCYERNTHGTWNLLTAAVAGGVKRVAFSSTINVYGQGHYKIGKKLYNPPYLPIDENSPAPAEDGYGLSKLANEQAMRGFSDAYGISTYCFRLAGVWWPESTDRHNPGPIRHGPSPRRIIDPWHYIDVRDVFDVFRTYLEMPVPPQSGVSYLVANETTAAETTMDLLERFIPEWVPLAGDRLPGHTPWFSNRRLQQDLGWSPRHSWRK